MSARHIASIIGVIAVLAIATILLRWGGSDEKAAAPAPAAREPAQPAPLEMLPEADVEPAPEAPPPVRDKVMSVPVVSGGVVSVLRLEVEPHPEPGRVSRVRTSPGQAPDPRLFEDLLRVAVFAALEGLDDAPAGLRVELDAGSARPEMGQMAPLAVAIRLGALGKQYPAGKLLTGLVAPDGSIVPLPGAAEPKRLAAAAGLELVDAPSVDRLLVDWRILSRNARPEPLPLDAAPRDPRTGPVEPVRAALREVVSGITAGRPVQMPPPDRWDALVRRAEAQLGSTRASSLDDLVTLGVAAAEIRSGVRAVRFAATRIEAIGKRIQERGEKLEGFEAHWLALLVQARVDGERRVRAWVRELPEPVGRAGRELLVPETWLRARLEELRQADDAFARLLRRRSQRERSRPRPYPLEDPRNLAWSSPQPRDERASVADWGQLLDRVGLVWSQFVVAQAVDPQLDLSVADPGALRVGRLERQLDRLLSMVRRNVEQEVGASRGERPAKEALRLVASAGGGPSPAQKVEALERLWLAALVQRDAGAMGRAIRGER